MIVKCPVRLRCYDAHIDRKRKQPYNTYEEFNMNNLNNMNALELAIIKRAIKDYKLLKELGVDVLHFKKGGTISKKEIESFFRSEWCDILLSNINLTGKDILEYLDRE